MARYFCVLALAALVAGAPPSPTQLYRQQAVPAHLQNITPLDYFSENSEVAQYYQQTKQERPARLESLEPDSEVELIPGAQQPQQPPQQTPVSPNLPGLVPGQRVFIVHMPVPGYRPGTIGGYQPVYIVAAAPQGNGYAANGYQNAILVNPAAPGQVVSPYFGVPQGPGLLLGGAPFPYRGFEPAYQQVEPAYGYHQAVGPQGPGGRGAVHLSQLVGLQRDPAHPAGNRGAEPAQPEPKQRVGEASESLESKEALREEPRRNARPGPQNQNRKRISTNEEIRKEYKLKLNLNNAYQTDA